MLVHHEHMGSAGEADIGKLDQLGLAAGDVDLVAKRRGIGLGLGPALGLGEKIPEQQQPGPATNGFRRDRFRRRPA